MIRIETETFKFTSFDSNIYKCDFRVAKLQYHAIFR